MSKIIKKKRKDIINLYKINNYITPILILINYLYLINNY